MSAPSAPNIELRPWPEDGAITFYWQPPSSDGGSPIINYTLAEAAAAYSQDLSANTPFYRVSGLTNGTNYTFTLTATNAIGTSPAATFRTVQPGVLPFGPSTVTVSTLNTSTALLTWNLSTIANEGTPKWFVVTVLPSTPGLSSYTKSSYIFERARTFQMPSTNIAYQFLVQAINDTGYCRPFAFTSSLQFIFIPGFNPYQFGTPSMWIDMSSDTTYTLSNLSTSNISTIRDGGYLSLVYNTRYGSNMPFLSTTLNGISTLTLASSINGFRQSTIVSTIRHVFFVGRQGPAATSNALFGLSTGTSSWANATSANYVPQKAASAALYVNNFEPFTSTWPQNINIAPTNKPFLLNLNNIAFTPNLDGIGYSVLPNNGGWNGDLGEVVCFSNTLTTAQISIVTSSLISKWFPIPSTNFSPSSISSCVMWLDMSQPNGFTMNGANVSTIRDFSRNGAIQNLLRTTYPTLGSSINGYSTVNVGNDKALAQASTVSSIVQIYFVGRQGGPQPAYSHLFGADGSYDFHAFTPFFADDNTINCNARNPALYNKNTNYTTTTTLGQLRHPDSNSVFLLTISTFLGAPSRIQGVAYDRNITGRGWVGDVGEVICFTSTLSALQQEQIELYLKRKWAIYPQPISSPTQIGSMQLWLDASDPYGNGTAPAQSTIISTLFDKSGLGRNAVANTLSNYYTSSGITSRPAIRMVQDAYYSGTISPRITGSTLYTFMVLSADSNTQIWSRFISFGSNTTENHYITRSNGTANYAMYNTGFSVVFSTFDILTSGSPGDIPYGTLMTSVLNGTTTGQLRINGTGIATATSAQFNTSLNTCNYRIGHSVNLGDPNSRWQGLLSEVLVYSTLTMDQVESVEAYLKRKWNV